MLEFVFDLFPTHLSTPTLRFLLAKELCLALQQTLHHLRFTYFHRQRHLRGRDKKWPDTFTDTVYQCQRPSSSMSVWILSKAYQLSISAPFSDSKDICTFWWWWDSKFYIRLLLIASTFALWQLTTAGIAFFELRSPSKVLHNCLQSISLTFCCRKVQRGLPVIVWQVNHGLSVLLLCFVSPCFDSLIDCEYHETEDVCSCIQSFARDTQNQKQHIPYLGIP